MYTYNKTRNVKAKISEVCSLACLINASDGLQLCINSSAVSFILYCSMFAHMFNSLLDFEFRQNIKHVYLSLYHFCLGDHLHSGCSIKFIKY